MAKAELTFNRTFSPKEFGEEIKCNKLRFLRNKETGKLFFATTNGVSGAIASKYDETGDTVISEVVGEDGEAFWLLHNPSSSNVEKELSLV